MNGIKVILFSILTLLLVACDEEESSSISIAEDQTIKIEISFQRISGTGLDSFVVDAYITADNTAVSNDTIEIVTSKGSISNITNNGDGHYTATVTPDTTGEYDITVTYSNTSLTRTALVLQDVHADWGQPQSVPGYPNTEGYEDGVTITPDGEYLFVQYGPYRWTSILIYSEARATGGCGGARLIPDKCMHEWINNTIGPMEGPERPGFFTNRFDGTEQLHNSSSWGVGVDQAPNYALTTMFYGFKKQADGTFQEPFYMVFDDLQDGIVGPFGLSFMNNGNNSYTTIFALKDGDTSGDFDVYTYNATFEENNIMGEYTVGSPPARGSNFHASLVDLGGGDNSGTQGNPFLYYSGSTVKSIWTDDEYDGDSDTHELSVYVLNSGSFPNSSDWTKVELPYPINDLPKQAIQPTFTGTGLYFTQDTSIAYSSYSGGDSTADFANGSSWSALDIILQKDTTITSLKVNTDDLDKIVAIGEPTIAAVDGKTYLYFVYAYIRGIDSETGYADLDFQAGFIVRN